MNYALFGKDMITHSLPYIRKLIDKLYSTGNSILVYESFYRSIQGKIHFPIKPDLFNSQKDLMVDTQVLFSFGGDGTILDAVTLVGNSGIPIAGINMGRLGFLSGIPKEQIIPALDAILLHHYEVDSRTLIRLETKPGLFGELNYALNDLTVYKSNAQSMLIIKTYVNGDFLNSYWADGLIISTPTGSTAYSLSCTGPIITPGSESLVITPIASHNLTVRPIVIPDDSIITIRVEGKEPDYFVSLDSRIQPAHQSVELTIRKAEFKINLLRMKNTSFFQTIREKLNWGLDIRN
jgi:NAD+ kinase